MTELVLNHYATDPLWQVRSMKQDENNRMAGVDKPLGIWLSDCSDYGWARWCINEGFRLDRLRVRTKCTVDMTDVLLLDTYDKMMLFNNQYGMPLIPDRQFAMRSIDWGSVADKYKGIVITPYQWVCRLAPDFFWYYGWDCASGCIWDVSCIIDREIDPEWSHTLKELQEMHEEGYENE